MMNEEKNKKEDDGEEIADWGTKDGRLIQRVQLGRGELLDKPDKKEGKRKEREKRHC
jgi:hypothetical protein